MVSTETQGHLGMAGKLISENLMTVRIGKIENYELETKINCIPVKTIDSGS